MINLIEHIKAQNKERDSHFDFNFLRDLLHSFYLQQDVTLPIVLKHLQRTMFL